MPVYTYICRNCEYAEDVVFSVDRRVNALRCRQCRTGKMTREFQPPQVSVFRPYVTRNITGEPMEIRSSKHETDVLNRHGLYRPLDSEPSVKPNAKAKRKREAEKNEVPLKEDLERTAHEMGIPLWQREPSKKKSLRSKHKSQSCKTS